MLSARIKLYEDREDITLTTYVLDPSPEMLSQAKRPAVIICPGGAYLGCSDREAEPVALKFASMGYHAFVLRYSTYFEGEWKFPSPEDPVVVNPRSIMPAAMRDLGKAMLYVKAHSQEWLVDEEKIFICGFSAGAHNCAMYSVYWDQSILTDFFGVEPAALKPAATVLGYMLSDYILMRDSEMDEMGKDLFKLANVAFTGVEEPDEATLIKISPARLVNKNTPPMFLWSTAEDSLVPVEHSTRMATALAAAKIPFEMHIFENGPHGMSLATQASAGTMSEINPDAEKWTDLVDQWLKKRFKLEVPMSRPMF